MVSQFETSDQKNGAVRPLPRSLSGIVFSSRLPDTALTHVREAVRSLTHLPTGCP